MDMTDGARWLPRRVGHTTPTRPPTIPQRTMGSSSIFAG